MRTDDGKSWQEKVNEAIILAYQAARKKFNKECRNIVSRCICDILRGVIINKVIDMIYMFGKCSDELKLKIRSQFKIFKEEAFQNDED